MADFELEPEILFDSEDETDSIDRFDANSVSTQTSETTHNVRKNFNDVWIWYESGSPNAIERLVNERLLRVHIKRNCMHTEHSKKNNTIVPKLNIK